MSVRRPTFELELNELRARLYEAEQTLDAIQSGEVDALIVRGESGEQVYTLKGAEQPYRVFVEQMTEGALTLDQNGTVLYSNLSTAKMLGVQLEKIIGSSLSAWVEASQQAQFERMLANAASGSDRIELWLQGSERAVPALVSVSPLDSEQEGYFAVTVTDLTEQKRTEEVLAAERLTRSILENASEAILVCDAKGTILLANSAASSLACCDWRRCKFSEAFVTNLAASETTELPQVLVDAMTGMTVQGLETTLKSPQGERDMLISAGALHSESTFGIGCVVTMTDITDKVRAYRQVREMNESLERRITERTLQLRTANKEMESFCYSVSHDLRAPLRGMVSSARILQEDFAKDLPQEAHILLHRISKNANNLAVLIDDLLQLSRIGRQTKHNEIVDFSQIASDAAEEISHGYADRNYDIEIQPRIMVMGDPNLLRLLVTNLLDNAMKFSPAGGSIRFGELYEGTDRVFFIEDSGIGFDMSYVGKLFLPFERLHRDEEFPGTGIGLANVNSIIQRHGGKIWAESRGVGKGATFYFRLGDEEALTDLVRPAVR